MVTGIDLDSVVVRRMSKVAFKLRYGARTTLYLAAT